MDSGLARLAAGVALVFVASFPAFGQGKGQQKKTPPSRNVLTTAAPAAPVASGTPFAWIDDGSLLTLGMVSFSVAATHWQNAGVGETDLPVVDAAIGLAPRVQLSASVPRVVGSSDPTGAVGGMGTSFFSTKLAVHESRRHSFKLATSPTMLVIGKGILDPASSNQSRVRWGLPVSAEISQGRARLYGGGGYFSPGVWFGGAALGFRLNEKAVASGGFSRAWRTSDIPGVPLEQRDRKEISGGVSYALSPRVSAFGSLG